MLSRRAPKALATLSFAAFTPVILLFQGLIIAAAEVGVLTLLGLLAIFTIWKIVEQRYAYRIVIHSETREDNTQEPLPKWSRTNYPTVAATVVSVNHWRMRYEMGWVQNRRDDYDDMMARLKSRAEHRIVVMKATKS